MSKQDGGSKTIRVFLRVRPPIAREKEFNNDIYRYGENNSQISIEPRKGDRGTAPKIYSFHKVYPPTCTQLDVYNEFAKPAVESALEGYHGVLFVYGQTGSGKTHTISSQVKGDEGMLQRSLHDAFKAIRADKEHEYTTTVSYVELYNEQLSDLIAEDTSNTEVRMNVGQKGEATLTNEKTGNSVQRVVYDEQSALDLFKLGTERKVIAATKMNDRSSRSHTIYTLYIKKRKAIAMNSVGGEDVDTGMLEGQLILCDLAGSERQSKAQTEGQQFEEMKNINMSLLVLGQVVNALSTKGQHAPFRDSKLTRLLQYALSGHGKTSLVVTVSPSADNIDESRSSIEFGQRAVKIKQNAIRHETIDYKALYMQMLAQKDTAGEDLVKAAVLQEKGIWETTVQQLKDRIAVLEAENNALRGMSGGGSASYSAPSGGGALDPKFVGQVGVAGADNSQKFFIVIAKLKQTLEEREQQINALRKEQGEAEQKYRNHESMSFRLAKKFKLERMEAIKCIEELRNYNTELQCVITDIKGRDYLPSMTPRSDDTFDAGDDDLNIAKKFDRALAALARLKTERTEHIAMQEQARKAIKLLTAQKADLELQLQRLGRK